MRKEIKFTKTFTGNGSTFSAFHEASDFVTENGFSAGSMQREAPIGLVKGEAYISKWRDLDKEEIASLDGVIRFPNGSPRDGIAVVELYIDLTEE